MLRGKRALIVIAPRDFRDEELQEPKTILEGEGVQTTVASTVTGTAVGMANTRVRVETTVGEVDPAQYDAVVIVGGSGSETYLWSNPQVLSLVQAFHKRGKVVAAVARGRHVLVNLGLFPEDSLTWGPPVEVHGNIIAGRPFASKAFARSVVETLTK